MKSDVVIIGGGIAGLATGALLAKAGKRVTVLEKGNQPGGRAYTYEDKGFTLNYGPHAVYRPYTGFFGEVMRASRTPGAEVRLPGADTSYWPTTTASARSARSRSSFSARSCSRSTSKFALAPLMLAMKGAKPDRPRRHDVGRVGRRQDRRRALRRFAMALAR